MNFKTTALLMLLLLGTAGLYLGTRVPPAAVVPAPDPYAPGQALVTGDTFRRIVIDQGGQRTAWQLETDGWWQVQPVRFPADPAGPDAFINAALRLRPRQAVTFRPADDRSPALDGVPTRADLGLGPAAPRITLVTDQAAFILVLGRTEVAGTAWLSVEGENRAYLVDPTLHDAARAADPTAWRPERLRAPSADRVVALSLRQRGRPAVDTALLTRTARGWAWGVVTPDTPVDHTARVDRDAATRLAAVADGLLIAGFAGDDPAHLTGFGLTDPVAELTLRIPAGSATTANEPDRENAPCILRLGRPAPSVQGVATRYATCTFAAGPPSPVVFQVPEVLIAPLLAEPDTLRDPRLVTADPDTVIALRVDRVSGGSVELARTDRTDGTDYRFVTPDAGRAADSTWGLNWFETLLAGRATAYVPAPPEAQAPLATATLGLTADREERVRLYADRDGRNDVLLCVRENEPIAAVVPAETLAPLLAPPITLHDTHLPPPRTAPASVRLQRPDGVTFMFTASPDAAPDRRSSTQLKVDGPASADAGPDWDFARFVSLRSWLAAPRAVQWTPLTALPRGPLARLSTGPNEPAYIVNVGQNLAQRTDLPGVFRLAPEITALFDAEYRSRLLIDARADAITALHLTRAAVDGTTPSPPQDLTDDVSLRDRTAGLRAAAWPPVPDARPATPPATWTLRVSAGPREWTLERVGTAGWRIDGRPVRLSPADAEALDAAVGPGP